MNKEGMISGILEQYFAKEDSTVPDGLDDTNKGNKEKRMTMNIYKRTLYHKTS